MATEVGSTRTSSFDMSLRPTLYFFISVCLVGTSQSVLPTAVHEYANEHFKRYLGGVNMYFCSRRDAVESFRLTKNQLSNVQVFGWPQHKLMLNTNTKHRVLVFLDASCVGGQQFLEENKFMISRRFTWLMKVELSLAINIFSATRFGFDSDVTLIIESEEIRIIHISRLIAPYPIQMVSNYSISDIMKGYKQVIPVPFSSERIDFQRKPVNVGVVLNNYEGGEVPDLELVLSRSTNESPLILYNTNIAKYLLDTYNINANITAYTSWGKAYTNGTYIGLVLDTAEGDLEVSFGSLHVNPANLNRLDVTCDMFHLRLTCLLIQGRFIGSPTALAVPFSPGSWVVLAAIITFLILTVRLTAYSGPKQVHNDSVGSSMILVFAGIRQIGVPSVANQLSTRLIYTVIAMSTYLVYQYYNVGILNGLVGSVPPAIRTYDQLLASDVEVHSRDSPHLYEIGRDEVAVVRHFWEVMTPPVFVPDSVSLVRVKRGKYGIVEADVLWGDTLKNYYNDRETCALTEILHPYVYKLGFGTTKFSPMTEILNRGIIKMTERGLINRLHKYWFTKIPKTCVENIYFVPITMKKVAIAYSVLIIGLMFSLIIFVFEIWLSKIAKKNSKLWPVVS